VRKISGKSQDSLKPSAALRTSIGPTGACGGMADGLSGLLSVGGSQAAPVVLGY
jgi:hypothetical protein